MTTTEQQPAQTDAQQPWDTGNYLAGLKGVTIPNTAPTFDEEARKGRHWSPDNAIQADDDSLKDIFASLNTMPPLYQDDAQMPRQETPARPAASRSPIARPEATQSSTRQEPQAADAVRQESASAQRAPYDFPAAPNRQQVDPDRLQFDMDIEATQRTPVLEEHGPIQQIDSNPPSFVPGSTPFEQQPTTAATATQQLPPTINHIPQNAAFSAPQTQPQPPLHPQSQPQPQVMPYADFVVPETNDSDEDAVPEQRKIKAEQVEQTLRAEHPDADDEFVSAVRQLVELNASDLHLVVNDPPMLRVDGKLRPAKGLSVWTKDHTYEAVKVMTNELERERFKDDLELDISFAIGDLLHFRVNVYRDRMGVCAALRTIPTEIKTAQELGLDPRIADLAMLPRGLVLVCGPTGSGKSTTLAAIVDKANAERADHIITIEDPIEFVHQHKRCVMSQREVGTDTKSFAEALKRALREDPDIIEVGELRDLETISTALTAVETGHLVFATLHTQDAGSTVDRLIDVYPENQQQQIRVQVASTLRAVIVQTLIPRASGHGRAPATEVMINNPAVAALIRGGKAHQIRTVLQSGEKEGMHTLDQDLARLVNKGTITFEDALVKVQVREEFEKLCGARQSF